jgi:hypothetical protein
MLTSASLFNINGNISDNANLIANHFNNFFVNIGPVLDNKIPKSSINPISFIKKNYPSNIFLAPCTEVEIGKVIDKLKNCATGWDLIPSSLLKSNKPIFNPLLTYIINLSLSQGIFPKEMKLANIVPIFKLGDPGEVGNYRPISLLTTFLKVYERIFCNRLLSFINKHKFIYELQFGFRENHLTYLAMITLMENIISALEKGHFKIGIFLDFSKALDTVNHQILLDKLNC